MDFSMEKCMQRIGVRAAAVYLSMAGWMGGLTLSGVPMCVWAKPDAEPSKAASKAFHLSPVQPKKRDPVVTLPVRREGHIALISDNGRFVITGGQLMDIWQGQLLTTLDQIQYAASHLDFKKLGLDIRTLNTLTLGSGDKTVVAFIDPRSLPSRDLVKTAQPLAKAYTFRFVLVPALGEASHR